ncbi:MAG: AAA family ATPase [Actinomycetota bacterium]|nr:AAA family ATPase [Acidimicrobiia bacterium]MDQ3350501.1 AAA family ATPase [Actinomycetota bacterium]
MKIAVVGKGGAGKTTTSAVLARTLARSGHRVVALDCDTNPNLGLSLGIGLDATEALLSLRNGIGDDVEHARTWDDIVERFGADAPDGVRLAMVSKIDNPDVGCPCCGVSPEQLLALDIADDTFVVADFEAGIGTLTRLGDTKVDAVVVVTDPTVKSLEVASRAATIAQEHTSGPLVIVANRVLDDADRKAVERALSGRTVVLVPEDDAIPAADRAETAPLDSAPGSEAVMALGTLASLVVGH